MSISGEITVSVADAGPELPKDEVRSPVRLFSAPAAVGTTSTLTVQLDAPARLPLV